MSDFTISLTESGFRPYHHFRDPNPVGRKAEAWARNPRRGNANERPFIGWDGEGYTDEKTGEHHYNLLANSLGNYIYDDKGIRTEHALRFMLDQGRANKGAIHVVFASNYDVNMILRGQRQMSRFTAERLHKDGHRWITLSDDPQDTFHVTWRPSREFRINDNFNGGSVTFYDVYPFFQSSFVNACDEYLPKTSIWWADRDAIIENKERRGTFTRDEFESVLAYCQAELRCLTDLMDEFRERVYAAGLRINKWYGPGAIAASLLQSQGVKKAMAQNIQAERPEVAEAGRAAYAGGRFELVKFGHVEETVYEYDRNSAYPYAMTKLPWLAGGEWHHVQGDPGYHPFALYRIDYRHAVVDSQDLHRPFPLYRRDRNGSVCYPHAGVVGWYWSPEYGVAKAHSQLVNAQLTVLEAWIFEPTTTRKPFDFIPEMYERRKKLKRIGNGAHVGIKLGLNSLYGKLAQQMGWQPGRKIPPFHQLEWAGFVTSHCRAAMFKLAMQIGLENIIAFETDAIFTTTRAPQSLLGDGLGWFEETVFSDLTYLQSGIYVGRVHGGEETVRSRGFHPRLLDRASVLRDLASGRVSQSVSDQTFVTLGSALAVNYKRWGRWIEGPRQIALRPESLTQKRCHDFGDLCSACVVYDDTPEGVSFTLGSWHDTMVPMGFRHSESFPFPVLWIDHAEGMDELEEARHENYTELV